MFIALHGTVTTEEEITRNIISNVKYLYLDQASVKTESRRNIPNKFLTSSNFNVNENSSFSVNENNDTVGTPRSTPINNDSSSLSEISPSLKPALNKNITSNKFSSTLYGSKSKLNKSQKRSDISLSVEQSKQMSFPNSKNSVGLTYNFGPEKGISTSAGTQFIDERKETNRMTSNANLPQISLIPIQGNMTVTRDVTNFTKINSTERVNSLFTNHDNFSLTQNITKAIEEPFLCNMTSKKTPLVNNFTATNTESKIKKTNETPSLLNEFFKPKISNNNNESIPRGDWTSLRLCNFSKDGNCRGRDEVAKEELDHRNHTSATLFSGEISKIETGTLGNSNVNGTTQLVNINKTDDFYNNGSTYKFTNLTEFQNCTGCFANKTKESKAGNIQINNQELPMKRCILENADSSSMKTSMSMEDDYDEHDIPASKINCIRSKIKLFQKTNADRKSKIQRIEKQFRRRLVSNHLTTKKNSTNVTVTNPTKINEEVNEKIEKEKNEERVVTNEERARANEERLMENEKIKYKILHGIHDQPEPEQPVSEERGGENRTIPIDPSMIPEQFTEPLTEDNKDARVGILGMDTSPAVENGTNITAHLVPNKLNDAPVKNAPKNLTKTETKLQKAKLNETQNSNRSEIVETMKKTILCFGDSLTRGYYAKGDKYHPYSIRLKELLEENDKNTEYEIFTEGVNGECAFKEMKTRLPVVLNETYPVDFAIILGGTNDLLTQDCVKDLDLFQEIKDLHEMCHKRGIKTGVVTIPQIFINSTDKMSRKDMSDVWGTVNQKLRVWSYSNNHPKMTILIDLADEFTRQNIKDDFSEYWDDDIHPSPKGYDRIGKIVFDNINGKI